eukprot:1570565-Ditylum_brightwellii.AAC.1
MDIVQFGMKSTLTQFQGKYYVYHRAAKEGEVVEEDIALVIGAYKSTFLVDIVAFFVFEKMDKCFKVSKLSGIYCND